MSEDSFITVENENHFHRSNQALNDLFGNYQKLRNEISDLKKRNTELEADVLNQKTLKFTAERKYQTALQDIEHYKIKLLTQKPDYEFDNSMEVDYENIYSINEENIKNNLSTVLKNCELERNYKKLEQMKFESDYELEELKTKYSNLEESNEELKIFTNIKKSEIQELQLKLNEMENASKCTENHETKIYSSFSIIDELQVKCFKLENENKKYKENHMNLLLLFEENTSLANQITRLEEQLAQRDNLSTGQSYGTPNTKTNVDTSRKLRHLERENEILKSQQSQLVETNSELTSKIRLISEKLRILEQTDQTRNHLFEQKQEQMEMLENRLSCLTRECESYKKLLTEFAEQSSTNCETSELLCNLNELYLAVESEKVTLEQQSSALYELTNMAMARLDQYDDSDSVSSRSCMTRDSQCDGDRNTVIELRQQLERLHEELDKKSQLIGQLTARSSVDVESVSVSGADDEQESVRSTDYYEMGFLRNTIGHSENQKSGRIFRKLSNQLLEAVRQILGFSVELGPNGHISVQSCLATDCSQLLEFQIENSAPPVLMDNSYSLSIKDHIESRFLDSFPALLAHITLDLFENHCQDDQSMCNSEK